MSDLSSAPTVPAAPEPQDDQPLGLTVYTMPTPGQAAAQDERRTRSGRWQMLLLALVCAAPVIASYLAYYVVRPDSRRVFGELIAAQPALPAAPGTDLNGQPFDLAALKGQWLLVSVAGAECDALCQSNLYLQRQLRESRGKDKERMEWVWLVSDGARVPDALRPALSQATVVRVPPEVLRAWLQPAAGHQLDEHLYVVDPLGHWMMRFPPRLDKAGAAKAKRDLDRLMRASASWDEAGR